jgi:hypothetical protein
MFLVSIMHFIDNAHRGFQPLKRVHSRKGLGVRAVKYMDNFQKLCGRKMSQPMVQISKYERKEIGLAKI